MPASFSDVSVLLVKTPLVSPEIVTPILASLPNSDTIPTLATLLLFNTKFPDEGLLSLMVRGLRQLLVLGSGLRVQEYGQEV